MSEHEKPENGHGHDGDHGRRYTFFVEGVEYPIDHPTITGGEIMDLAGIPRSAGLILYLEDGTQRTVGGDEVIELKPGRRFGKAPNFDRGAK